MTINSKTKYYFDKSQINSGQFEGLKLSSSLFKVDEIALSLRHDTERTK